MSYLLWANIYLGIFYGFYWICLRQETFFQLNRWYFLSAVVFSFTIPLIDLDVSSFTPRAELFTSTLPEIQIIGAAELGHSTSSLLFVYLIGCFITSVLFLRKFYLVKKSAKTLNSGDAYSFFYLIKVDPQLVGYDKIVAHEQVHIKQLHSLDVLILEIVRIVNWFNPIIYLYIRAVKLNHEYIADKEIAQHEDRRVEYANLLVDQAFNTPGYSLRNNFFNKPILKKRIIMLFKNKSKKSVLVRFSILIPVMLIAFGFQAKKENLLNGSTADKLVPQKQLTELTADTTKTYTAVETPPQPVGGLQAFYKFVGENYAYPKDAELAKVKGRILLTFVVERDGSLVDIEILRDLGYGTGEAAVKMLEKSPKWNPGIQNGEPVRVKFTIPIQLNPKVEEAKTLESTPTN